MQSDVAQLWPAELCGSAGPGSAPAPVGDSHFQSDGCCWEAQDRPSWVRGGTGRVPALPKPLSVPFRGAHPNRRAQQCRTRSFSPAPGSCRSTVDH